MNNRNENFLSFRAPQDHDRFAYAASLMALEISRQAKLPKMTMYTWPETA